MGRRVDAWLVSGEHCDRGGRGWASAPLGRSAPTTPYLRGFGEEVGEVFLGVEMAQLETEALLGLHTGPSARWRNGGRADLRAEMDLGRCGSGEPLVWAKPEVVEKGERKPVFEITPEERGA